MREIIGVLSTLFDAITKIVEIRDAEQFVTFAGVHASDTPVNGEVECVVVSIPFREIQAVSALAPFDWRTEPQVFQVTKVEQIGSDSIFIGQGEFGYEIVLGPGPAQIMRTALPEDWYDRYYQDDDEAIFGRLGTMFEEYKKSSKPLHPCLPMQEPPSG